MERLRGAVKLCRLKQISCPEPFLSTESIIGRGEELDRSCCAEGREFAYGARFDNLVRFGKILTPSTMLSTAER